MLVLVVFKIAEVVVLPYNVQWKDDFEKIKSEIINAIGDLIIDVEHVGSTSVEGMSAKPCIDIDVIIKDYSAFDIIVSRLEMIGYIYEGNLGIKDREAFKYFNKPHFRLTICMFVRRSQKNSIAILLLETF